MGVLRDRMFQDLVLGNYSESTIEAYLYHIQEFTRYFNKSPAELNEEHARQYLFHLRNKRELSWSTIRNAICAFNFFYTKTLHKDWDVGKIPRPKTEQRLPVDLSRPEVKRVLEEVDNQKHRVILTTIYSGGLRISEATHLKVSNIDSPRMRIRVEHGKGKKDRDTLLAKYALDELRDYWRAYRPTYWLFPGRDKNKPIGVESIQKAFKKAKKKPASISQPRFTVYATALPPICLKTA